MKFSAPSVFAIVAAFAPSLVSAANITVTVGASQNGTVGLVSTLIAKLLLLSDWVRLPPIRGLILSGLLRARETSSTSSSGVVTTCVPSDL